MFVGLVYGLFLFYTGTVLGVSQLLIVSWDFQCQIIHSIQVKSLQGCYTAGFQWEVTFWELNTKYKAWQN